MINVLLLGADEQAGLCDVIMLVNVNFTDGAATVIQIPRDTYAEYGSSYFKINGIVKALGEEGACNFFESSMGITLDGYISLELEGFRALVDSMGGVDMNVEKPLRYSDPEQGLYIDLPAGRRTLNGREAEMLVRYRSGYARGDLDRLDAQKKFLAAFFISLREKVTPFNAYSVVSGALPYLSTDISPSELVSMGLSVVTSENESVRLATLPGEDAISEISGASFYVASASSASALLEDNFGARAESFDTEGVFLHPSLDSFRRIYRKNAENEIFSLDELK
ncbi:MAG: LCP family protein [Clostridia bacterium]|nr:LCP family protein [Clostridia bacterium]